mmetsp:Transcript_66679/g.105980  ORF Transcript_66679/g.105980 Transcript_66679/m.105980 type:complete len:206 (+) Transcript_66679:384-1001(+)
MKIGLILPKLLKVMIDVFKLLECRPNLVEFEQRHCFMQFVPDHLQIVQSQCALRLLQEELNDSVRFIHVQRIERIANALGIQVSVGLVEFACHVQVFERQHFVPRIFEQFAFQEIEINAGRYFAQCLVNDLQRLLKAAHIDEARTIKIIHPQQTHGRCRILFLLRTKSIVCRQLVSVFGNQRIHNGAFLCRHCIQILHVIVQRDH